MYLFSRRRQSSGAHTRAAMGFAVEIAAKASTITGFEVTPWASVLSADAGTFVWTAMFGHLEEYEEAMGKLMADAGYMDAVEQADKLFLGSTQDGLAQVLHGAPDPDRRASYASSVRAVCANGRIVEGITSGIELAEIYTQATGVNAIFGRTVTGSYGGVGWIIGFESLAEMEAAEQAANSNEAFVAAVDRIGPSYQPETVASIVRRLA